MTSKETIKLILEQAKLQSAWALEHNTNKFFLIDNYPFCKGCNLPMKKADWGLWYICPECSKTVSQKQVIEKKSPSARQSGGGKRKRMWQFILKERRKK